MRRQYFCRPVEKPNRSLLAEVAHLVEHDLAKVGVAGSSPVFRSTILLPTAEDFFCPPPACCRQTRPGGEIGRHAGLKILWPARAVSVQLRSGAHKNPTHRVGFFVQCAAIRVAGWVWYICSKSFYVHRDPLSKLPALLRPR